MPSLDDKPNMPFTNAVLYERLRLTGLAYQGIPHQTLSGITLTNGYRIPKDTILFLDIYGIQQNPAVFKDPDMFKPERFLDKEGQFVGQHDHMVAFGVGKRTCIAQSLAEKELFLFFTGLMQRYTFKAASVLPKIGPYDSEAVILRSTPSYQVIIDKRI